MTSAELQGGKTRVRLCQELHKHTWKAAGTPEHPVRSWGS